MRLSTIPSSNHKEPKIILADAKYIRLLQQRFCQHETILRVPQVLLGSNLSPSAKSKIICVGIDFALEHAGADNLNIPIPIIKTGLELDSGQPLRLNQLSLEDELPDFAFLFHAAAPEQFVAPQQLAVQLSPDLIQSLPSEQVGNGIAAGNTVSRQLSQSTGESQSELGTNGPIAADASYESIIQPVPSELPVTSQQALQAVPDNVRELLSQSVSRQAIAAIENTISQTVSPSIQSITIEINPADLGQLNIQIELVADSLQTRIVATENFSAELLSRNKDELVSALSEFGYSETNVDISHHDSQAHRHWDYEIESNDSFNLDQLPHSSAHSSLVMLVGVNLVA